MKVGHIININDVEYCICDIKNYGQHQFAYATSNDDENTAITFFELIDDENGTLIKEVESDEIKKELLNIFLYDEEE